MVSLFIDYLNINMDLPTGSELSEKYNDILMFTQHDIYIYIYIYVQILYLGLTLIRPIALNEALILFSRHFQIYNLSFDWVSL